MTLRALRWEVPLLGPVPSISAESVIIVTRYYRVRGTPSCREVMDSNVSPTDRCRWLISSVVVFIHGEIVPAAFSVLN